MIDYRPEVRADLLEHFGVDLARWWQERRWRALLQLIDQLPTNSRLNEAIFNDPDQAELIARQPKPKGEWSPRLAEYDLNAMLLREIREAVIGVRAALYLVNGHRAPNVAILPSPRTVVDEIRERLSRERQDEIVRLFAPHAWNGR